MVLGLRFQRAPGKPNRASTRPSGLAPGGGFQEQVAKSPRWPPSSPPNSQGRHPGLAGLGAPGRPAAGRALLPSLLPQEPRRRRGEQSTPRRRRALTFLADGADVGPGSPSAAAPRGPAYPGAVAPSQRGAAGRAHHGGAHGAGRGERGAGRHLCGPGSPRRLSSVPVPSASGSGALPQPAGKRLLRRPGPSAAPAAASPRARASGSFCHRNESKSLAGASGRRRPAAPGTALPRQGAGLSVRTCGRGRATAFRKSGGDWAS